MRGVVAGRFQLPSASGCLTNQPSSPPGGARRGRAISSQLGVPMGFDVAGVSETTRPRPAPERVRWKTIRWLPVGRSGDGARRAQGVPLGCKSGTPSSWIAASNGSVTKLTRTRAGVDGGRLKSFTPASILLSTHPARAWRRRGNRTMRPRNGAPFIFG